MGVQQNCEGIADNRFTLLAGFGDLISWKNHTNASKARSIPIRVRHLSPVGLKPVQGFDFRSVDRTALKKMAPPENRLGFSQPHPLACEPGQPSRSVVPGRITPVVKSSDLRCSAERFQASHARGESWQYALLLPRCV